MNRLIQILCASLILSGALPSWCHAENRTFSLPSFQANPGAILVFPVSLDNAAGLAGIRVQVNFDPQHLDLVSATPGPLGALFTFEQAPEEGLVQLDFVRANALSSGSGHLALLRFQVKANLPLETLSELALADLQICSPQAGVDLLQIDSVQILNGSVTYTASSSIDNFGNGLPDFWENQYGLDPLGSPLLDPDRDGFSNLAEYAANSHPLMGDTAGRIPGLISETLLNEQSYLTLSFVRRTDDPLLQYRLEESTDLLQWTPLNLASQMIGAPQTLDDFSERVQARGSIPMNTGAPRAFLRVSIQR
jgi:hypothetical protein